MNSHTEGIAELAFPASHICVGQIALLGLPQLVHSLGYFTPQEVSRNPSDHEAIMHNLNGLSLMSNQESLKKQSEFNSSFFYFFCCCLNILF